MRKSARRAFTLMEVVLVMAILIIVAALAIPIASTVLNRSELHSAADEVRTQLTRARNRAMEERRPYRFAIKENSSNYKIAPNTQDYWSDGEMDLNAQFADGAQPLVEERPLKGNVRFGETKGGGNSAGSWRTVAVFLPDGSAEQDVEISLNMPGAQPVIVRLQAATGSISTASLPARNSEY